jgi:hypothetical protein
MIIKLIILPYAGIAAKFKNNKFSRSIGNKFSGQWNEPEDYKTDSKREKILFNFLLIFEIQEWLQQVDGNRENCG